MRLEEALDKRVKVEKEKLYGDKNKKTLMNPNNGSEQWEELIDLSFKGSSFIVKETLPGNPRTLEALRACTANSKKES